MKKQGILLLTILIFAFTASFAQSKKDMEADMAKCNTAKDSIQNLYTDLSKSNEALTKKYDSIHIVNVKYDTMYAFIKDKVFHYNFAPEKIAVLIDSVKTSKDNAFAGVSATLSDSIALLKKDNDGLKAQLAAMDQKTEIVNDLKKLKELLDSKIITQQEFDTKKAALLEKF